jgi:pimeloyl-ACP methyl ester carboxylesterase
VLVWLIYHRRAADPAADLARGNGYRPQTDDEQLRNSEVREVCIQSELEAFHPGLRGLAWDVHLLTLPWGFHLEDIRIPVSLWSGGDDDLATPGMTRYMSENIPGCKTTSFDHEAHLLLFPHWQEILTQLISE